MQVNNIIIQLKNKIASTTDALEVLTLAKVIQTLQLGNVGTVLYYSDLPAASTNTGLLYYVEADELLYWSDGFYWTSMGTQQEKTIWSWGGNTSGFLGDNSTTDKSSPVSIAGTFSDWCSITSNRNVSLALKPNGTMWSWGRNSSGRLGDGTTVSRSSPGPIVGGFTDWQQISTGGGHNLALRSNGSVWSWGFNTCGGLGIGTGVDKCSPVSIVGGFTDWCDISAGYCSSAAIRTNSSLWTWGGNTYGQLGDGTTANKSSPISVVGGFTDWCDISGSYNHKVAVRKNGTAWAWGQNCHGRLGDGTTVNKSSPVSVVGGFVDWVKVSTGKCHSAGLRSNGSIWSWGHGVGGKLGDNTAVNKSSPVSVSNGGLAWCQVSAGYTHTVALRTSGTAWAWGYNTCGGLGDGTTVSRTSPVSVIGGFTNWCKVSAGCHQTSAIRVKSF